MKLNKMLENPLAIIEEHATIIIRSEDLARRFAVINMSRALDEIKKELGLPELSIQKSYNSTITTQTTCPPG